MIPAQFDYVAPESLDDALAALQAARTPRSSPAATRCFR